MLKCQQVFYSYPGEKQPILKNFSWSIPAGKKIALIGRNGSGKSTLLLLAAGLYRAQQGNLYWQSEVIKYDRKSLSRWQQRIGLAFQDPEQQLVAGTVAEDISYGLCNLELPEAEIERRLQQALTDFGLQDLAEKPLHHLSLGQKRRVALAGVMVLKPQLLLLDEPTAYLDRLQTHNFLRELERIHATGTTAVMATHDLNLAYQWADWIAILHEGQVVMEGETQDIFVNRELMEQLQLGFPLLWEVWDALCPAVFPKTDLPFPKNIRELQDRLRENMRKSRADPMVG